MGLQALERARVPAQVHVVGHDQAHVERLIQQAHVGEGIHITQKADVEAGQIRLETSLPDVLGEIHQVARRVGVNLRRGFELLRGRVIPVDVDRPHVHGHEVRRHRLVLGQFHDVPQAALRAVVIHGVVPQCGMHEDVRCAADTADGVRIRLGTVLWRAVRLARMKVHNGRARVTTGHTLVRNFLWRVGHIGIARFPHHVLVDACRNDQFLHAVSCDGSSTHAGLSAPLLK